MAVRRSNTTVAERRSKEKFMRRLIFALLICICMASVAADDGVRRTDAYLGSLTSLRATFEQTLYDENSTPIEDSKGTLYLQRPGRFRWEYTEPYPQTIVADGANVWVHDVELAQVSVKPIDDAMGDTPALLLTSSKSVQESFAVQELGDVEGYYWVELSPRSAEATFKLVRLGFKDQELRVMDLLDNFEQTTQVRLSELSKNTPLDAALFSFTPPDGVDVTGEAK